MPIVEAIAFKGLEWAASKIVNRLITDGFSYVGMDVPAELTQLETDILPKLSLAMKALPTSYNVPQLKPWLQRLQDAYYEAEDLLDEAEYQRVDLQNKTVRITSHPVTKPLAKLYSKSGSKLSFLSPQKRKLWRQLTEFKNTVKMLVDDAKTFHQLLQNLPQNTTTINANAPIVSVTSSQPPSKVFGRDEDRDHLVELLLEEPMGASSKQSYSVVAIVGRGGAGKSTLAQYVFNDERVVSHFDMRIWISLKRKLDIVGHTKEMIESATKKDSPQLSSLDVLQHNLKKILVSKNILLVLDDIWYNNNREVQREGDWERLMLPFTSIGKCSVLLTSRSKELPEVLHANYLIDLKDLKEDELASLFGHYSHLEEIGDLPLQHKLRAIGIKIVAKLGQSPLATKAVAGWLRIRLQVNVWKDALERANFSDTTDGLMWSFQQLDEPLQRCFLHCSAIPKGETFSMEGLVKAWMALNLIQSPDTNRDVKDIGEEYFNELLGSFFFEPISNETMADESRYRIHDNFHDLAETLSKGNYYRIEDDKVTEIPPTVHHLTITVTTIKQHAPSISKLKNLRSLMVFNPLAEDSSEVLKEILGNSKKLRLLELSLYGTEKLPKTISDLKYLKFLNIKKTSINQLPESLSKLYLLQSLKIPNSVTTLPRYMSNLINLRDLSMYDQYMDLVDEGLPLIRDVGKMTSLQELCEFQVRKESGYEIQQLRELTQLGGLLRITGLENVRHKDEAAQVRLKEKARLEQLKLVWSPSLIERDLDIQVIDVLQPPPNLEELTIDGYAGGRYPVWFENSMVQNIDCLHLIRCNKLEELPRLSVNLEELTISICHKLVFVSKEDLHTNQQNVLLYEQLLISKIAPFVELASQDIDYLKEVVHLEGASFKEISIGRERDFSEQIEVLERCLEGKTRSFEIDLLKVWWHCHRDRIHFIYSSYVMENQLKSLSNLRFLNLFSCNITDGALSDCLFGLTSLQELRLEGIMSLTKLPGEEILKNLGSLRVVQIDSCWLLHSLGALHALSSLEKLEVVFCPCLDMDNENNRSSGLPSSLQSLEIQLCSIPSGIVNSDLPCLNAINFFDCHSASLLSIGHLSSLRSLKLYNCVGIRFLEGLHLLSNLEEIRLVKVPKLELQKSLLSSWPGCSDLTVDNMQLLKLLLSSNDVFAPTDLTLGYFDDEEITFDFEEADLDKLASVKYLFFFRCRSKSLPTNLRTTFPSLEYIQFDSCPEISALPELPESVTMIEIDGCPVLKERCCYKGEDWPKVAHIQFKYI